MTDVEKYIAGFEPEVQQRLHTIRNIFLFSALQHPKCFSE
jgi:flagellar assembly factor FliW